MIKRAAGILSLLCLAVPAQCQPFTLDRFIQAAVEHHPLSSKSRSEQELLRLKLDALQSVNWPDISLNAQVGYQSMVPEFPLRIPGVSYPDIPKDRYQASVDIQQRMYDGGLLKQRMQVAALESEITQARLQTERYPVQHQVVDAWFGLEQNDIQERILLLTLDDLEGRTAMMQAGKDHGVTSQMDVDRIEIESNKVRQRITQLQAERVRILKTLSELTGLDLGAEDTFEPYEITSTDEREIVRPEFLLLDLSAELSDERTQLEHIRRRPVVSGYAQGAYGRPGLDLFSDSFAPFWQAGIKASWSLWDKGGTRRDQQVNQIVKNQLEDERDLVERSIRLALIQQEAEIRKNSDLLASDVAIMELQERVKMASEARLEQGIMNTVDYLNDVRSVEEARLRYESRKLAIRHAMTQIRLIKGGL